MLLPLVWNALTITLQVAVVRRAFCYAIRCRPCNLTQLLIVKMPPRQPACFVPSLIHYLLSLPPPPLVFVPADVILVCLIFPRW